MLLGLFSLYACVSSRETLAPGERVVLGLLLDTTDGGPWGREGAALVEKAQAAGFEVLVRTATGGEGEIAESRIRGLIRNGAQLLVTFPSALNHSTLNPDRDYSPTVPMIACGELIPGLTPTLLVGPDLQAAGYLQAWAVREQIRGSGVVLLGGAEDDPGASRLRVGQLAAFTEWEEQRGGEIGILADLRLDEPSAREVRIRTEELLARPVRGGQGISAIIAFDDEVAAGAATAVREKNLTGRILVAGRGGSLAACRRIIGGEQLLTLYIPPEALVSATVSSAIRLFRGVEPEEIADSLGFKDQQLDHNGEKVSAVLLPPVLVTRATMVDTVILDGLYPAAEVYGGAGAE